MKPKELLYSLDHVGEDLLAGAEQTVLARKHRPWAGTAAAALLIVAAGVGGFFLWKSLRGGVNPAATGEGPSTVTMPSIDPNDNPRNLPLLTVGDCWTGLSRARFDDLERSMAGSLASEYRSLSSLPVYERETAPDGALRLYDENALNERMTKAAEWLGASLAVSTEGGDHDNWAYQYLEVDGVNGSSYLDSLNCKTDQGALTVYADGRIQMLYNEESAITSHVKVQLAGGLTAEETERTLRDARMEDCGEQLAERLGLGECRFVTCDRWDPASSAWTAFTIYPRREDPAEQLAARYFESVRLLTSDGRTLRGFELDRFPREEGAAAPEGLRLAGSYPVIAPGEAINGLDMDCFLCEEGAVKQVSVYRNALYEQLVYLPEAGHELLMPFYRFWVPADESGESGEYIAVYVPAVQDSYLADWELYRAMRLPSLTVGEVARDEPALLLTDPEAYRASNPWRDEDRIYTLPVYEPPETGAQDAAMFFFAEEDRYTPDCGAGLEGSARSEELIRAFTAQVVTKAGLRSDWPWNVVEGEYPRARTFSGVDGPLYAAEVYLATDYVGSRILNYNLQRITLWYRDGTLWGFSLPAYALSVFNLTDYFYAGTPKTEGSADPDAFETELPIGDPTSLTELGLYPIISPAEARELAWAGKYAGAAAERPAGGLALLPTYFTGPEELMMDLVYLPNGDGTYLMPFYRFLFPIGGDVESGAEVCEARYVPAVNDLYLADYPPETDEPAATEPLEPTETQPTEPTDDVPEPTELPDETQPDRPGGLSVPTVVELPDGTPGIQGPAGTVKALLYLGDCEDPVWADLNRDGRKELIYWCHGPTSGLFTVGLCVYGLEQGWPVLKDGVLYNLDWGQLRLTEEDGQIFLHYERSQWDPATQTHVAQPEQALSVTLEDGKLVLNGGKAPEGCELWGSSDLTRFGRSFSALEQEVKDSCFIKHWACLVWAEPSYGSTDTQQKLCAAASTNGVTVTGYLRWLPQPNGTVDCVAQGLEAIEAPEDPQALAGLTMEELTARFGPCHFDMGSGMYIPCWFTKDCRMLVVHMGGAANSAELRDLATAGN